MSVGNEEAFTKSCTFSKIVDVQVGLTQIRERGDEVATIRRFCVVQ